ncbi:Hint domain-containing protein [Roseovarius sp. 2305UL8-3]|uniref:Hint domain-containing protein n=1 Tax=Roseovarius conchicola TaxID=3121636 RepID=UPI003526E4EB
MSVLRSQLGLDDLPTVRSSFQTREQRPFRKSGGERMPLVMRKFEVIHQRSDGSIRRGDHIGPAVPAFEAAYSAFAHGSLVTTTRGPIAVEDLEPGMKLITREHGSQPIQWIGAMRLVPQATETSAHDARMTRIMSNAFGFTRPERDLMAGPGARILRKGVGDGPDMLVPVRHLSDGVQVIDIVPPSPVMVYHLCLRKHATVLVNGLEMESFHPGIGFERNMGQNMLSLFLSMFPHITRPEDFGAMTYLREPLVSPAGLELA